MDRRRPFSLGAAIGAGDGDVARRLDHWAVEFRRTERLRLNRGSLELSPKLHRIDRFLTIAVGRRSLECRATANKQMEAHSNACSLDDARFRVGDFLGR